MLLLVPLLTNLFTWWTKDTTNGYIGTFLFIHVLHSTKKKKNRLFHLCLLSLVWVTPGNQIHIKGYISPSQAVGVKIQILLHAWSTHFPVFLPESSDVGGDGEPTQIRLYSLSSLPHGHAMDKDMINYSKVALISSETACHLALPPPAPPPSLLPCPSPHPPLPLRPPLPHHVLFLLLHHILFSSLLDLFLHFFVDPLFQNSDELPLALLGILKFLTGVC